jgi:hypothetical protein
MNDPDHDALFRAVMDARRILSEDPATCHPEIALERLSAVLNRSELVHTLDRINRQPVSRLSGMET